MSARKTVNVFTAQGQKGETVVLPKVFDTPIRADLVNMIYTNLAKNQMQPHAVSPQAGVRPSAISWGTGRAKARVPRVNGSGSNRNGQAAYANFCRGGHRFGPPTVQRRWFRPVPLKQRRFAIASAIAASGVAQLVESRGHAIKELNEIPIVVADEVEKIQKTKQAIEVLKAIKVYDDVKRVIKGKCHRSSKGKMRRSAYKLKRGPLVIYNKDEGIVKAFRNIPGVDVQCVSRLSLYTLAPGATLGRLVVWTKSAFEALDKIYESKKGFVLPRSILANQDLERVAYSDEVQNVLRPALQTFSVPKCRCQCRLNVACKEWEDALKQIAALREEEEKKNNTPEAIKKLFDEVAMVQPPAPENLSVLQYINPGFFDELHNKADDALEAAMEAKNQDEEEKPAEEAEADAKADPKAAAKPADAKADPKAAAAKPADAKAAPKKK